jgi:hypothetical protein
MVLISSILFAFLTSKVVLLADCVHYIEFFIRCQHYFSAVCFTVMKFEGYFWITHDKHIVIFSREFVWRVFFFVGYFSSLFLSDVIAVSFDLYELK